MRSFHADSLITYKGATYTRATLGQLKGECAIPHDIPAASGVAVHTICSRKPLRVTLDHLVYTSRGLLAAGSVRAGDTLFADLAESHPCTVTSVERESGAYFGLNCRESVVLADGIKTSTFGNYHHVPALWMRLVGGVLGIERASAIGDRIAQTLAGWKLL